MSKKRIASSILVIILTIVANVLIIGYKYNGTDSTARLQISVNSDEGNDMEVFFLNEGQKMPDAFNAQQSALGTYNTPGQTIMLEYEIPADAAYIRLDLGTLPSETIITAVDLSYGSKTWNIPISSLADIVMTRDIDEWKVEDAGLVVTTQTDDPYIVWNTANWGVAEYVTNHQRVTNGIVKGILCFFLDLIVLVLLRHAKKLVSLPLEIWQNRKLIIQLAKNDFKTKYAGSYLGIVWAFIQPIVTVLVYWFVFDKGLKAGSVNTKAGITVPFVLWLVAGLVPWFFFSDALTGGTNALTEYSYLVKKVVFKISILPIVKVLSALFVHVFFIVFTLCLYAGYQYFPTLYTLQILYYTFCTFVLVLGLSYMTCAIVGFFKDLTQVINILLQIGVWMTPIMWNIDTMELSPVLITIFKLNPMYYVVAGYRDALINHVWFWEKAPMTLYFWIVTILILGVGMTIFKRLKVHFADVL